MVKDGVAADDALNNPMSSEVATDKETASAMSSIVDSIVAFFMSEL